MDNGANHNLGGTVSSANASVSGDGEAVTKPAPDPPVLMALSSKRAAETPTTGQIHHSPGGDGKKGGDHVL